jgi:hypothetical protein
MALTRIKTNNILDRQVFSNDLADSVVTFEKIQITGTANAGDVLKVNGSGELLFEPATGTSTNLNSLTDVNIVAPQNFDSLVYNDITGNWEASSKTSSSVSLASLSDTTFVFPLQQHQYLHWDGNTWDHIFIQASHIQGLQDLQFDSVIDQMADVDTTTVTPIGGDALVWNGTDNWVPLAIAGVGASSNTFVVADIAARDALTPANGDSAYVRAGTSGEYEQYLWDAGAGPAAWILLATQDSARTDANTIEALVDWNDSTPQLLGNVSNGSRITTISLEVITIFDGTDPAPKLSIGDGGDNGRIIGTDPLLDYLLEPDFDLKVAGTYTLNVDYVYDGTETPGTTDTDINAYFDFTGSTQGQVRVVVTHV